MNDFITRWAFVRAETLEILGGLTADQLVFTPQGDTWQPLYYQFACMARTQLVYANAVETGVMDSSLFSSPDMPNKHDYRTQAALHKLLKDANDRWLAALQIGNGEINWDGDSKLIEVHIMSLAEHERLHHGQLIAYFTLAGLELPSGFKKNWAL